MISYEYNTQRAPSPPKQLFAHYLKIKIVYPMEEQKDIKYQGILRYPSMTLQAVGDYI